MRSNHWAKGRHCVVEEGPNHRVWFGFWDTVWGVWRKDLRTGRVARTVPLWPLLSLSGGLRPEYRVFSGESVWADDEYLAREPDELPAMPRRALGPWIHGLPWSQIAEFRTFTDIYAVYRNSVAKSFGYHPNHWGCADTAEVREALLPLVQSIPHEIREVVGQFGPLQWRLLELLASYPPLFSQIEREVKGNTHGYFAACLALAGKVLEGPRDRHLALAKRLVSSSRRELLSELLQRECPEWLLIWLHGLGDDSASVSLPAIATMLRLVRRYPDLPNFGVVGIHPEQAAALLFAPRWLPTHTVFELGLDRSGQLDPDIGLLWALDLIDELYPDAKATIIAFMCGEKLPLDQEAQLQLHAIIMALENERSANLRHGFAREIRRRVSVEDIVGQHADLVFKDGQCRCICPFHVASGLQDEVARVDNSRGLFFCRQCGPMDVIEVAARCSNVSYGASAAHLAKAAHLYR